MPRPDFVTEIDVSGSQEGAGTWVDVSDFIRAIDGRRGAPDPLSPVEAAEATYTFDNRDGTFDDDNPNSILAGFEPGARIRTYADRFGTELTGDTMTEANTDNDARRLAALDGDGRPALEVEFWAEYAAGANGTADEWTASGSVLQGLAGAAARQFSYQTTDPRIPGARFIRQQIASGDKFGSTTGERAETYRDVASGLFGTGDVNGLVVTYEWSFRLVAPFTHKPSGWEIFEQLHADDAKFGQAPFRFQSSPARDFFRLSIDSGEFPTSGDAIAGTNAGTNLDLDVFEMVEGEWLDCRLTVYWTRNASGYVLFDMKRKSEDVFTRTEALGIQTLPTILGDASTTNIYDKLGPYRPDWTAPDGGVGPATWNVDYWGYRVTHHPRDSRFRLLGEGDSSFGVYRALTNLVENSSFETNANGTAGAGGSTPTPVSSTDRAKNGARSLKVDTNGGASGQGAFIRKLDGTRLPVTAGLPYTVEVEASGDDGVMTRVGIEWSDSGGAVLSTTFERSRSNTSDWRRRVLTVTAPANAVTARIRFSNTGTADTLWYIDAVRFYQGAYRVPHAAVDNVAGGGTRAAGRLQHRVIGLDETQGWIAMFMRLGFPRASAPGSYAFLWGDNTSNYLAIQFDASDKKWKAKRVAASSGAQATLDTDNFVPGQYALVVMAWTATALKISVDGSAFVSVANSSIPTLAATDFDFGSGGTIIAGQEIDSQLLWANWGTGTLTDADVADIFARYAREPSFDPPPTDVHFPATAAVQAGTPFTTTAIIENGRGYLFSGFTDEHPEAWPASGADAVAVITANDGIDLLAETPVPTSRPDFAEFADVLGAMVKPTLHYPLDDEAGTKLRHRVRHEYHNHNGGLVGAFIKHHRTTYKVTRSRAEGITGPAGSYKNTPLLGEPPLIKGAIDTSVRFRSAQSEWAKIVLENADTDLIDANRLTMGIFFKAASVPANGSRMTLVCLPQMNGVPASEIANLELRSNGTALQMRSFLQFAGGAQGGGGYLGTGNDILVGDVGMLVMTWDGTDAKQYAVGSSYGDTVTLLGTENDAGQTLGSPASGDFIRIARSSSGPTPQFFDGWLAHFFYAERALSIEQLQRLSDSARLRGWDQELASDRIAAALDELGLWTSPYLELEPAAREIQPVRQGGQAALEPIRDAELVDGGRFFFMPSNVPKYLAHNWRDRQPAPIMVFGDAAAFTADPTVVPYRDVSLVKSRDQLIREARVTRVGSDDSQIVTSSLWSAGKIKPSISFDVLTITDAAALEIAEELVTRYEEPQKRVEGLELVGRDDDGGNTWPAFFLDVGDRVQIVRNPPGAPQKSLDAHVEGIAFSLNPSGEETVTLTVSPR